VIPSESQAILEMCNGMARFLAVILAVFLIVDFVKAYRRFRGPRKKRKRRTH
jgi:hypothetical protein